MIDRSFSCHLCSFATNEPDQILAHLTGFAHLQTQLEAILARKDEE